MYQEPQRKNTLIFVREGMNKMSLRDETNVILDMIRTEHGLSKNKAKKELEDALSRNHVVDYIMEQIEWQVNSDVAKLEDKSYQSDTLKL